MEDESLAIFDMLVKEELTRKERENVKRVAKTLLEVLKQEKLKINRWRESEQLIAQVRTFILNELYQLPADKYPDAELEERRDRIYLLYNSGMVSWHKKLPSPTKPKKAIVYAIS